MKRNVMWQFPQLSWFQINEVRQKMNKFLRTAYPTPSNKTTGTPASARGSPPSGSWRSREEPRPADGWHSSPDLRAPRQRAAGRAPRAATGTGLHGANSFYHLNSIAEPRPGSPGAPMADNRTRGRPLSGPGHPGVRPSEEGKGGAPVAEPGLGPGRRRGSEATARQPLLLGRSGSRPLRAEGRPPGAPAPLTGASEPSPSMLASARCHQPRGPAGRTSARQGLVGWSLRRPGSRGCEPERGLVCRTDQRTHGSRGQGGRKRGAERRGSLRRPGSSGGGGGSCGLRRGGRPRGDMGVPGAGRGGAAPSPGQQRPPHKGGGATGGAAGWGWAGAAAGVRGGQCPPSYPGRRGRRLRGRRAEVRARRGGGQRGAGGPLQPGPCPAAPALHLALRGLR